MIRPLTVKIAEFKAHLSKYLRAVREGREVVIHDRDHPVARVVPWREEKREPRLHITPAQVPGGFRNLKITPVRLLRPDVDPVDWLLEDRREDDR